MQVTTNSKFILLNSTSGKRLYSFVKIPLPKKTTPGIRTTVYINSVYPCLLKLSRKINPSKINVMMNENNSITLSQSIR